MHASSNPRSPGKNAGVFWSLVLICSFFPLCALAYSFRYVKQQRRALRHQLGQTADLQVPILPVDHPYLVLPELAHQPVDEIPEIAKSGHPALISSLRPG